MIINTGARTDIPAFFSEWFLNRIKAGFVCVRNPYYPQQVTRYRLDPAVVDCLLFCTKNPRPLLMRLPELAAFNSYWFVTITPYGTDIEPYVPPIEQVVDDVRLLAAQLGSQRVCWRYDPIFIDESYGVEHHIKAFREIAAALSGYTDECVISFIDLYEKTKRNFPGIRAVGLEEQRELAQQFSQLGKQYGISVKTCAEALELNDAGIKPSGCVTRTIIEQAIGAPLRDVHVTSSRTQCGCSLPSRDIGAYNTCPHGCKYCYANYDQKTVRENLRRHDPASPLLVGQLTEEDVIRDAVQESYVENQFSLW